MFQGKFPVAGSFSAERVLNIPENDIVDGPVVNLPEIVGSRRI